MPNRLIREGFLDSEAIHSLSDAAECFFHRLMLTADDAGRMDGRVEILRARLFPLDISRRASDVEKTLSECLAQGLVIPYERKGQRFLQLTKWQRCSPCATSKYPWRDGSFRIEYVKVETRDGEKDFVATSLAIPIPSVRDTDGIEVVIPRKAGDVDVDVDEKTLGRQADRFSDFWTAYPKRVKRKPTLTKWKAKRLDGMADEIIADVQRRIRSDKRWLDGFIPDPLTYITQERWQDEVQGSAPPSAVQSGKPKGPSETPLEAAHAFIRRQFQLGAIQDEAERDRQLAEATAKHRGKS